MAKAAAIEPAEFAKKRSHISVERYFETSLLLMLTTGFVTVATTGKVDLPSVFAVSVALAVRLWGQFRERDLSISSRTVMRLSVFYIFFFVLDFLIFSPGPSLMDNMLAATVHLVLFTAVMKVFSARTYRDFAYLAALAFMMILASAILTVGTTYLVCFTLFILFAISTLISYEIKRSTEMSQQQPEGPFRVPAENRKAVEKALTATTAGLAAVIVLLASVLFFVIPRYRTGYLTGLGMEAQNITGFSGTVNLGDIRKILQSNEVVMRVVPEGDPRDYRTLKWRGLGLTSFDGKQWYKDNTEQKPVSAASYQRFLIPPVEGWETRRSRPLRYRVLLSPVSTDVLFAAAVPREIRGRIRVMSLDQTDSLHSPGHSYVPLIYKVVSDTGIPSASELRRAPAEYPAEIRRVYLQLPDLDPRIANLAREITTPAPTAYEKAVTIEQYLRNRFTYTLDPRGITPENPLGSFLFEAKSGYCEYFAAAMTVMLRTLEVPARLVNGFNTGTYNRVGKDFIVRGRDAHSWVEVYFPTFGWITFDPTPADPNPVIPGAFDDYIDAAGLFWSEWIINYDFAHQKSLARSVERDSRQMQQDFARRIKGLRQRAIALAYRGEAWLMAHKALVFLFMLAVLAAIILAEKAHRIAEWRFGLMWRFRRKDRALSQAEATLTYNLLLKTLGKLGFSKPLSQTPREFALSFAGTTLAWPVLEFTRLYNALRFGQAGVSLARLRELMGEITAVKKKPTRCDPCFASEIVSFRGFSAVDGDHLAGDESALSGKEQDRLRNVLGAPCLLQWSEFEHILRPLALLLTGEQNRPRRDAIHQDLRGKGFGERARQHNDAGFGRAVMGITRPGFQAPERRNVDDSSAPFLLFHDACRGLRAEECSLQVDPQYAIPVALGEFVPLAMKEYGSIVNQDIKLAEFLVGGSKQVANLCGPRNVGANGHCSDAHSLDLTNGFHGLGARAVIVHRDVGARTRQGERDNLSDPPGGTGHQSHAAAQRVASWHMMIHITG